jgi:hypothetical protein
MSLINSETTQLELISKLLMVETATLGHLIDGGLWLPQLQCVLQHKMLRSGSYRLCMVMMAIACRWRSMSPNLVTCW